MGGTGAPPPVVGGTGGGGRTTLPGGTGAANAKALAGGTKAEINQQMRRVSPVIRPIGVKTVNFGGAVSEVASVTEGHALQSYLRAQAKTVPKGKPIYTAPPATTLVAAPAQPKGGGNIFSNTFGAIGGVISGAKSDVISAGGKVVSVIESPFKEITAPLKNPEGAPIKSNISPSNIASAAFTKVTTGTTKSGIGPIQSPLANTEVGKTLQAANAGMITSFTFGVAKPPAPHNLAFTAGEIGGVFMQSLGLGIAGGFATSGIAAVAGQTVAKGVSVGAGAAFGGYTAVKTASQVMTMQANKAPWSSYAIMGISIGASVAGFGVGYAAGKGAFQEVSGVSQRIKGVPVAGEEVGMEKTLGSYGIKTTEIKGWKAYVPGTERVQVPFGEEPTLAIEYKSVSEPGQYYGKGWAVRYTGQKVGFVMGDVKEMMGADISKTDTFRGFIQERTGSDVNRVVFDMTKPSKPIGGGLQQINPETVLVSDEVMQAINKPILFNIPKSPIESAATMAGGAALSGFSAKQVINVRTSPVITPINKPVTFQEPFKGQMPGVVNYPSVVTGPSASSIISTKTTTNTTTDMIAASASISALKQATMTIKPFFPQLPMSSGGATFQKGRSPEWWKWHERKQNFRDPFKLLFGGGKAKATKSPFGKGKRVAKSSLNLKAHKKVKNIWR